MARKKAEPIKSLGKDEDKLLVQKSLPLFSLWRSQITLPEFKILDTYLSRIDSRKPEKRTVVFGKGELEKLLGVKKIDTPVLKKRLHNLMSPIDIEDASTKKGFKVISLFEEAVAEQDENEQWTVKMTCTNAAMHYVFNIENLGYLRYKLRCITNISSRYTYILFLYLEQNRYRKSWEIGLEELKKILDCEREETYKEYKRFNDLLLKRVQKEMFEKTECRYTYEPVKKGRRVTAIRFTVETLSDLIEAEDPNQITIDQWQQENEKDELWTSPLKDFCLSREQKDEIRSILCTVPSSRLPEDPVAGGSLEIRWYHYIDQKVKEIKRRNAQKDIKDKFAYLRAMMQKDATER